MALPSEEMANGAAVKRISDDKNFQTNHNPHTITPLSFTRRWLGGSLCREFTLPFPDAIKILLNHYPLRPIPQIQSAVASPLMHS